MLVFSLVMFSLNNIESLPCGGNKPHFQTNPLLNVASLVMTNIAMFFRWPIEIEGLPIKNWWICPWLC